AGTTSTLGGRLDATAAMLAGSPTRSRWSSGCAAAWSRAPGTTSFGPKSPPIASTARRIPRFVAAAVMRGLSGRASIGPLVGARSLLGGLVFLRRLDLDHRPARVVAAVRAGVMAALGLVAVRALFELRKRKAREL